MSLPKAPLPAVLLLLAVPALAQPTIDWSGRAYVDYEHTFAADNRLEQPSGFFFRRLYLTANYRLSDAFSGRARLEANSRTVDERGVPHPFVKDLYVRWAPTDHRLTLGLQPPPTDEVAEAFWGYRSLARTFAERSGAVSSRDFGLEARGPLFGPVGYALMVANNEGTRVEDDRHKRVYGQLRFTPTDALAASLHGDYATYADERDHAVTTSAFAGLARTSFRVGAEAVWQRVARPGASTTASGASLFVVVAPAPRWEVLARADYLRRTPTDDPDVEEAFALAAVSYAPTRGLRLIPNVFWNRRDDDRSTTGRFTLFVSF
ncbi:MAG: hypothetical protein R3362_09480 [Rhodothermales bacterium]|nr:hypothetical protein [Rhodothermales bacterium]